MLQDAADLTGCDRAVQQQKEAKKLLLLKKKWRQGKSNGTKIPIPSFAFSCVESIKFSSAGGTSCVKGHQPPYTNTVIFSPQADSVKSKMSTNQGLLALLPLTGR